MFEETVIFLQAEFYPPPGPPLLHFPTKYIKSHSCFIERKIKGLDLNHKSQQNQNQV